MSRKKSPFFSWSRLARCLPLLVLAMCLVMIFQRKPESPKENRADIREQSTTTPKPAPALEDSMVVNHFQQWWDAYRMTSPNDRLKKLEEGRAILEQRRQRMLRLIRENPQQALAESLKFHEYEMLPKEWQAMVEKPFSAAGTYDFYPICGAPAGMVPHIAEIQLGELRFDAFTYGCRAGMMSKKQIPVQGVTLDGIAAMADLPLRILDEDEFTAVRSLFPNGQKDLNRSFLTGELIAASPVRVLGGGRIFSFSSVEEIESFNERLVALDALPGPRAGSDVIFQAKATDGEEFGFAIDAAVESAQMQASAWTENPKNVFLIRADFSDQTGLSFSQANTAAVLNGVVSHQIRAMSYGKTWINAGVSANLYRMPQTATYYVNGGASRNGQLLRDARNTFRNTRSGGDASVDIGPVSNNSNGDGGGLGVYDIVGVLFPSINMQSGIVYAGLAGGGNLWMQGNISEGVFTHEFGHNYGIGHSSFWQTNDGSVLGSGANEEYGDDYDIMGDGEIPEGHFHAQAKAQLNWLANHQWSDATLGGSNTYRVHRIDSQFTSSTPRGVRITRSAAVGNQEYLWLNYRPLYAGVPAFEKGAYMVWQRPGQSRSWLVDTTPATSGVKADAPITLGKTFADATSNAFITPVALGGAGENAWLDVRVNFGPFPGNAAPVAGVISGASSVAARTSQAYAISATDANGDTLAYSWNIGDGSVSENSANLSQQWIVGGNYTLNLQVSDMKGGLANASKSITVTDPLDTWTAGSVGTSDPLENVLYAKGRYIAADYWGGIHLSWDGGAWVNVGALSDMDQPELAFGANVFVAVGIKQSASSQAQIMWSVDGRRWQQATSPNGIPYARDISFGNGKFVAVGDDGTVLSSADGKTWSVSTVGSMPDFRKIVWSGSGWVAAATSGGNAEHIWTSPDAVSWTQGTSRGFDIYQLIARNGTVYALGWYGGIEISRDHGVTWTGAALPAGTRWTTYLMAIASDGTMLCTARAMDENLSPRTLLVSVDGQRWVRSNGNAAIAEANGLVWGNGQFLTVDSGGVTQRCQPFFPTNNAPNVSFATAPTSATARQFVYFSANATDANGDALTYAWDFGSQADVQDGFEMAMSFTFGGPYNATLRVSDGSGGVASLNHAINIVDPARTFTSRSVSSSVGDLQACAASSTRVVAVGSNYTSFKGSWVGSSDGTSWSSGEFGLNEQMSAITHDGTQFIVAGQGSSGGWRGLIKTSTDGVTWTQRYFLGTELYAIAHGGGVYLAAGKGGSVIRSTNGTSWSSVSIPGLGTNVTFGGLAWNGSIFLLTGYTGSNGETKVFTSSNGTTWTDQSAGAGVASWQDLRKSAWLHDRFVSSGFYSKLRVSTNGGSAFTSTRSDSEETPALAYGGGIYFAAGVNRSSANADIDLLSLNGSDWFSYAAPTTTDRNAAVYFNNSFITVGNSGSIWQSAALTGSNGFGVWQTTNFPSGGLFALADRDPDQDGLKNFLEYALGLSPHAANVAVTLPTKNAGRTWLQFSLPSTAQANVRYVVQGTTNLNGGWTTIATKAGTTNWVWSAGGTSYISTGAVNAGNVLTQVGMPDSVLSQPRYFMRLLVEPIE